jgi:hypothetical protein
MLPKTQRPSDRARRTARLAGLVLGIADGFLSLEIPVIGLLLVCLALVLLGLRAGRAAGLGGLAIGFGGTWVAALLNERFQCSTGAWQGCTGGSLDVPYLVAGAVILAAGIGLTLISCLRRRA